MKQEFRQSHWRTVLGFAAAYAATAVAIVACAPSASSPTVATHGDRNTLVRIEDAPTITDARLCAAVAAYSAANSRARPMASAMPGTRRWPRASPRPHPIPGWA